MFTNKNIQQSMHNENSLQILDYVNMTSLFEESPQDSLMEYIVSHTDYIQSCHLYTVQVQFHCEL